MKSYDRSNYAAQSRANHRGLALLMYIGIFALWVFEFIFERIDGTNAGRSKSILVFTTGTVMCGITAIVLFVCPNDRENTLKAFKGSMAGYFALAIVLKLFVMVADDGSGGATFLTSFHDYYLWLAPVGYIIWQAQKIAKLYGNGKSKREAIDYYKDHGNDGSM